MPPADAVTMENWFPEAHEIRIRPGCISFATSSNAGLGNAAGTLIPYNGPSGSQLFLGLGGPSPGIFRTTGATLTLAASTTDGNFSFANFTTPGGSFLYAANGVDSLQLYNGVNWQAVTGVSPTAITGVPTSELNFVIPMKKRLWFCRNNSMSVWYLPVDAIAGALVEFPMGTVFKRGGRVVAMGSWSVDGGDGVDDHSIFVTSEGEIAVYSGSDPASAATWTLVGLFYVGEPLGKNCLTQFGGDLLYLCRYGLFPLSKSLTSATIDRKTAITNKIDVAFNQAVADFGSYPGWQTVVFPGGPLVLVNIPIDPNNNLFMQFVMNTLTGAWCKFLNWNSFSWVVLGNELYFYGKVAAALGGYTGLGVNKAWIGSSDVGQPIVARCQQAFNYFGLRGRQKLLELVRPILSTSANLPIQLGLDTDFVVSDFTNFSVIGPTSGSVWGAGVWGTAIWGAGTQVQRNWTTIFSREFYAAALRLQVVSASGTVRWTATDFVFRKGGVL